MPINYPTEIAFRFGEMQSGQGYSVDKPDFNNPGLALTANPVSLVGYEESLPEVSERESVPGVSGSAFKEINVPVRGARSVKLRMAVHPGRDDSQNKSHISGRDAADELHYWMFNSCREGKFHTWDTRYLNYFVKQHKWKFIPGMNLDNMDMETELVCADPFYYAVDGEYGKHTWVNTAGGSVEEWSGGTSGRVAGDEVGYPVFSLSHNGPNNIALQTGLRLTHVNTGRALEWYGHLSRYHQFFVELGTLRATTYDLRGQPWEHSVKTTVRGVPLWLLPDGNVNEFKLEPIFPNNAKPPAAELDAQYAWRPRFQI